MRVIDALGAVVTLIAGIAALSLVVNPQGRMPEVIGSFGKALADNITAAKSF